MSSPVPPPSGTYPQAGDPAAVPPATGQLGGLPVAPGNPIGPIETEKKSGAGKLILRIVVAIVIAVAVFGVKTVLFGDKTQEAKAGDCVSVDKDVAVDESTETGAKVVDCGSSGAKYDVVARVEGESSVQSKSCDQYFKEGEEFFVLGSSSGKGYLLCLRARP